MKPVEVGIAIWGVLGVVALLSQALYRLTPVALEILSPGAMDGWHWVILFGWVGFNAYAEGYVGFHLKFSPRVVERALELGRNPTPLRVLFAAPYCMGLFNAPRRRVVTSWVVVLSIVALVLWVRHLAQPWRGIVDAGVVVGLGVGVGSLALRFAKALVLRGKEGL